MKRLICLVITLVFLLNLNIPVYATSDEIAVDIQPHEQIIYSEYSAYIENKQKTDEELLAEGFTVDEIEELKAYRLEDALLERATHTEEELHAMGYTDEQIKLLKAYDGSPIAADNPVLAATAVCTGSVTFHSYNASTKQLMFLYHFSWSVQPLNGYTDNVAVSWKGVDANAYYISSSATYMRGTVYYRSTSTGEDYTTESLQFDSMPGFDGYEADYETVQVVSEDNGTIAVWAKEGYLWFGVTPDGNNAFNMLKVYGAVGHVTSKISASVGIGYSSSGNSYSFSFTPSTSCQTVGKANYTLKPNGTCYEN